MKYVHGVKSSTCIWDMICIELPGRLLEPYTPYLKQGTNNCTISTIL